MALPSLPKRLPKSCGLGEQPRHLPPANRTPSRRLVMGLETLCLDFGKNPEPEPGRCRRTDGKKWQCCRNVIPNEKYCERHMHRGRKHPVQLVVEDDEPDSASGSKSASSKATEGVKKTDDKSSISKNLAVEAPAAV